MYHKNL